MKTTLEEELISALRARAAALPMDASEKLRSVDYHPRRHRRAAAAALGATAVGAAAKRELPWWSLSVGLLPPTRAGALRRPRPVLTVVAGRPELPGRALR